MTGFSTNHAELEVAERCASISAQTVTALEFLPGQRLDGAAHRVQPLHWMVGTRAAAAMLEGRFAVPHGQVHVTGSSSLETFARRRQQPPLMSESALLRLYYHRGRFGHHTVTALISIFLPAPEAYVGGLAGARPAIAALLTDTCAAVESARGAGSTSDTRGSSGTGSSAADTRAAIVVRVHPRTSPELLQVILTHTNECALAILDTNAKVVDNESLLRASRLVISHGSTTLVESTLLGIPALFYKRDFDDSFMEATMRSVRPASTVALHNGLHRPCLCLCWGSSFAESETYDGSSLSPPQVSHAHVPRIATAHELRTSINRVLGPRRLPMEPDGMPVASHSAPRSSYVHVSGRSSLSSDENGVEGHIGATARQWAVVTSLLGL